ncbi:MAG: hypothetical protein WCT14_06785 [Treponemataceae bacterium]
MRRRLIIAFIVIGALGSVLDAQSLEDVIKIGNKSVCTIADLVAMAPAFSESFPDDPELGERLGLELSRFKPGNALTKARAALVAAKALRLRKSLFFLILPIQRYAFRTLVVDGVFSATSSGGEVMSGIELLDFVSIVCLKYGSAQ